MYKFICNKVGYFVLMLFYFKYYLDRFEINLSFKLLKIYEKVVV